MRRVSMKAIICLVCLTAVTIINAKHIQDARRTSGRDVFIENRGKFVKTGGELGDEGGKQGDREKQDFTGKFGGGYSQGSSSRYGGSTATNTLQKQAFLLAALANVNEPAIEEQLEQLGQNLIANEQMYDGNLDEDMQQVLQMAAGGNTLGKQDTFNSYNAAQLQQMIGLYKLMARASNWDTFQRNVCFARQNINDEVFIGALVAAVKERSDTQDLVMPAVSELLPELFYDQQLIQYCKNIQPNSLLTSPKQQFGDVFGDSSYKPYQQSGWGGKQSGMKTWQQWREERLEKQAALRIQSFGWGNQQKLVLPLNGRGQETYAPADSSQRIAYLTKDVGLNNFWYSFMNGIFSQMNVEGVQSQGIGMRFVGKASKATSSHSAGGSQQFLGAPQNSGLLHSPRRGWQQTQQAMGSADQSSDREYSQSFYGKSMSQGYGSSYDEGRLLKTSRRRLYAGAYEGPSWMGSSYYQGTKQYPKQYNMNQGQENSESSQESDDSSSEQQDSGEGIGQDSEENQQQHSDERSEAWGGQHTINQQRLLKVNRRKQNQKIAQSHQNSAQKFNALYGEGSNENSVEADSQGSDKSGQGSFADDRLLKVNRRRMNQKMYAYQSNAGDEGQESRTGTFNMFRAHSKAGISSLFNQQQKGKFSNYQHYANQQSSEESDEDSQSEEEGDRQRYSGCYNSQGNRNQRCQQSTTQNLKYFHSQAESNKRPSSFQGFRYETFSGDDNEQAGYEQGGYRQQADSADQKGYTGYFSGQQNSNPLRNFFKGLAKQQSPSKGYYDQRGYPRMLTFGRRRVARDISGLYEQNQNLAESRSGEVIITTLQQIMARLQMEQLSQRLEDASSNSAQLGFKRTQQQQPSKHQQSQQRQINYSSIQGFARSQEGVEPAQIEAVLNTKRVLQSILQQEIQQMLQLSHGEVNLDQTNILDIVGKILTNQGTNAGVDILNVWDQLQQQLESAKQQQYSREPTAPLSNYAKQLQNPLLEYIVNSFLEVVNEYKELLPSYSDEDLQLNGVQLNSLEVDKLQTYFDTGDVDLTNAMDQDAMMQQNVYQSNIKALPVGRQPRLNHKSFSLKYDVQATQPRRVVIRTFLGPKLDAEGNELSLEENRCSFILLDAFTTTLSQGRNTIKRKSSDFEWTSQDATSFAQMYKEVMQGIQSGSQGVQLDRFSPNNCQFPQRLLLPRGLPNGLPMQLFAIITSVTQQDALLQQQQQKQQDADNICGMGIAAIALDNQPLGFPLDRKIDHVQNIMVPNAILKDVTIYHSGQTDVQNIKA